MSPLVTLLVLGLLLVVVLLLLVWAIVTPGAFARGAGPRMPWSRRSHRDEHDHEPAAVTAVRVERASNDELRGAKAAKPTPRASVPDDAFERFLRSGRDDDR